MSNKKKEQLKKFKNAKMAAIPDIPDERDFEFPVTLAGATLPSAIDLRQHVKEIENQSSTGSCVANACCSALELIASQKQANLDLSRLFVYWNIRADYSNLKGIDGGAYLRDAFKSVNKMGVPNEKDWDFDVAKVNVQPPQAAYEKAIEKRVLEYRRVNKATDNMKGAIAENLPVIMSMELGTKFYTLTGDITKMKYTKVNVSTNKSIGWHAMVIVGYDDNLGGYLVENSWGTGWGDKGLCLLPYSVFEANGQDAWVCTNFNFNYTSDDIVDPEEKEKQLNWLQKIFAKIKAFFFK